MADDDDAPVVDGVAVEEHDHPPPAAVPTQELTVAPRVQGSTDLIVAATAREKVEIAAEIATTLDDVIKRQGMRTKMGKTKVVKADGKEVWEDRYHVNVEAWQTLATLLGLAVVPTWSRRVLDATTGLPERVQYTATVKRYYSQKDGGGLKEETTYDVDGYNWESRVEVFKDGVLIAAGEGMCSRTEETWNQRDDYAVRGMAMTRATSRAIAGAAKWIVTLAGYSGTPAEEFGAHEAPQGEPAPALEPLPDEMRETVMQAIAVLISPTIEHAPRAQVVEVAQNIARLFPDGKLPKAIGLALMGAAGRRQRLNKEAAAPGNASPQDPDGPRDNAAAAGQDNTALAPAGTIDPPDLSRAQTVQAAAQLMRDAGCVCDQPLGPKDKTNDNCPIKGHGIPF